MNILRALLLFFRMSAILKKISISDIAESAESPQERNQSGFSCTYWTGMASELRNAQATPMRNMWGPGLISRGCTPFRLEIA
jgi:hypothetical protein